MGGLVARLEQQAETERAERERIYFEEGGEGADEGWEGGGGSGGAVPERPPPASGPEAPPVDDDE